MKDVIIITSVIRIRDDLPLYYRPNRNVFPHEQRYAQTLHTIDSVRKHFSFPHRILFIECSNIVGTEWESVLSSKVDDYINAYTDPETVQWVESINKNLGEVRLLLKAFDYIQNTIAPQEEIRDVYKLSGRYYLEPYLHIRLLEEPLCISKMVPQWNADYVLNTIFYKIPFVYLEKYHQHLKKVIADDSNKERCCEYFLKMFYNENQQLFKVVDLETNMGISGLNSDLGSKHSF